MTADKDLYDAVIVGGGPAGLTAALYLARARYRVLVVEKEHFGGQITITAEVVNYPGVARTSGAELTETMRRQAEDFGSEFLRAEVTGLKLQGDIKEVQLAGRTLRAFSVLLATGANPRRLGFKGEAEFRGRGVAYCATCDGEFFTGKELLVVGGGFAAAEEALFLTRYATRITMLVRRDKFSCAQSIAETVLAHPKITVRFNTELQEVSGDSRGIREAVIINNQTNETDRYQASGGDTFGVFVFAGYVPNTALIKDLVELDEQGCIVTSSCQETSVPGVFAAGDVCRKILRQVVTATADGAIAACAMEKTAAHAQALTGLKPERPAAEKQPETQPQAAASAGASGSFIQAEMVDQLNAVFTRMQSKLYLEVQQDASDPKGAELWSAMQELCALTDKLELKAGESTSAELPCVRVLRADGTWTGLAFHGVPGGHEFTSFILGLYNASGPGQPLEDALRQRAQALSGEIRLKILVSLSCTMCPDLVTAAQRLAALNDKVTAEVYDLNLYPALREQHQIMSVPCLLVNDQEISFGRKDLGQLLDYIERVQLQR